MEGRKPLRVAVVLAFQQLPGILGDETVFREDVPVADGLGYAGGATGLPSR